jgi:putative cell wall-binding protein
MYETSIEIGRAAYPSSSTVIIANGERAHLSDGLVAAPLAGHLRAPILLVSKAGVPKSVQDELRRRHASTAYIIGGPSALPESVVTQLRQVGVTNVQRLYGPDRYGTAAAVADRIGGATVIIASARDENLVDALGAGGAAAKLGLPILLTDRYTLPATTQRLAEGRKVVVAGGPSAVSDTVLTQLPGAVRLGGPLMYDTAVSIANYFKPQTGVSAVVVAAGTPQNKVDALPGGALGRPILLTSPTSLPAATRSFLRAQPVESAAVLGGPSAVSEAVRSQIGLEMK